MGCGTQAGEVLRGLVEEDDADYVVRFIIHSFVMPGLVRVLISRPGSSSTGVALELGDGRTVPLQYLCVFHSLLSLSFRTS